MSNHIIVRYSEIGLKGGNRILFEQKLIQNIQECFKKNKLRQKAIKRPYGRIMIETDYNQHILKTVFGIASYSFAIEIDADFEEIKKTALDVIKNKLNSKQSFRVSCQRLDKSFKLTSNQIEIDLGSIIQEKTNAKVSLKKFDVNLQVEIIRGKAYVFLEKHPGPGGLPVGISGKMLCLIEDENSLAASLLMLKRGCNIIPLLIKDIDISILEKYSYGIKLIPTEIKNTDEIPELIKKHKAKGLTTNDTMEKLHDFALEIPVYRPIIALNQKEIGDLLNDFRQRVH